MFDIAVSGGTIDGLGLSIKERDRYVVMYVGKTFLGVDVINQTGIRMY